MKHSRRWSSLGSTLIALILSAATCLQARAATDFPSKPVTLVVSFAPGGSADILARVLAPSMSLSLGVPVVVTNILGAAGMIATNHVAKSAPDGYTLLVTTSSPLALTPHTSKNVSYDPFLDFAPISLMGLAPEVLALNAKVDVRDLPQLIEMAKRQGVTISTSGNGGLPHLALELLRSTTGLSRLEHVPYKAAGPAVADAVAGHVNGVLVDLPAVYGQIRDGKLRGILIASSNRSEFLPDLKTAAEQGYPDVIAVNWTGLLAPARTPPEAIEKIHAALLTALKDPVNQKLLRQSAVEIAISPTPDDFARFIRAEHAKWGKVVREAGVRADD